MRTIAQNRILQLTVGVVLGCIVFALYNTYMRATSEHIVLDSAIITKVEDDTYQKIVLAGGCFWCTESEYNHLPGVISAVSGYADTATNYDVGTGPSYKEVSSKQVRAREAVQVIYDPSLVSISKIIELYFRHINPTDNGGQFADRGYQYSPAIYYLSDEQRDTALSLIAKIDATKKFDKPVVVEVLTYRNFFPAEEYHQDYKDKNAVRYTLYKEGSGRTGYIKDVWSDSSPFVKELFSMESLSTSTIQKQKTMTTQPDASWKHFTQAIKDEKLKTLTPLQFNVTQKNGTERPFQNEYNTNKEKGIYVDIVSGEPLFFSQDKYDSGTGWPSFVKPISESVVVLKKEDGFFSSRIEVRSSIADSHLGHVFDDGPSDRGGKRYCMNSASLRFIPLTKMEEEGYGEYVNQVQ